MNSTTTHIPYDWIRTVPRSLLQSDAIPLFGNSPPFPIEEFTEALKRVFELDTLQITAGVPEWREKEKILTGFEDNNYPVYINVSPIESSLCWLMSKSEIDTLMNWVLTKQTGTSLSLQEPSYQEGFYNFLIMEAIHALSQIGIDKDLSFKPSKQGTIPSENALCSDIAIQYQQKTVHGRLIIPQSFLASWRSHYLSQGMSAALPVSVAQKIEATVHLEIGRTTLTQEEYSLITPGDFITLDSCTFQPDDEKGRLMMTLNGHPLFRARLKAGNLKIFEIPLYHDGDTPMSDKPPEEHEDETFDEDLLPDENIDLNEDENQEEPPHEEHNEGEEFADTSLSDFDEDLEEEQKTSEEDLQGHDISDLGNEEEQNTEAELPVEEETAAEAPVQVAESKKEFSVKEMPVNVVIEVGRLQLTLQKLLELQPGNMLEIDVKPENGVDLVVNGKCIGKGELIKLGEILGVRVLDIG